MEKAAIFFLRHRLFHSCKTNEPRQPETFHGKVRRSIHSVTDLHYPLYWHYDILQALTILHRAVSWEILAQARRLTSSSRNVAKIVDGDLKDTTVTLSGTPELSFQCQ